MSESCEMKAGGLLQITEGEYSDFQVVGFFVALKTFTPDTELHEYLEANQKQREEFEFESREFLAGLLAKGLLLEIDSSELHLGGYGSFEELRFTPARESDE